MDDLISDTSKESRRLKALRQYHIMDTGAEKAFDNLAHLAAMVCETPISLISLVDDQRQWFKSQVGLDVKETPREQAFCAHAIKDNKLMVVEDATEDERFVDNPLVTGEPGIRFYAGAPLKMAEGEQLGTLCIIDRKPRSLTEKQRQALEVLRDAVVTQLELRRLIGDAERNPLPLCSWCHSVKLRGSQGETWQPLQEYFAELTPLTHSICPSCLNRVRNENHSSD